LLRVARLSGAAEELRQRSRLDLNGPLEHVGCAKPIFLQSGRFRTATEITPAQGG
jgi:hypothetical protein